MGKTFSLRYGKNAKEVKRRWMFNHPNTVVSKVQRIGKTTDGKEYYYHVFYHERKKESQRSKVIRKIREQGGKYGKVTTKNDTQM